MYTKSTQNIQQLKPLLDKLVERYNQVGFIENDPISIPHRFSKKQDIEIAGLFAATLAWGQRKTIVNSCRRLMDMMDGTPHDFVLHHTKKDLQQADSFKHRTFNGEDLRYFLRFLQHHYKKYDSLENAFIPPSFNGSMEDALSHFNRYFFDLPDALQRTQKHVATPERKSACKRLNMYLRWMVRKDECGVDFGLWSKLQASQLICPLDVHVNRMANELGLINRTQADWKTAMELTAQLRLLNSQDPVIYDFALFGLGIEQKG